MAAEKKTTRKGTRGKAKTAVKKTRKGATAITTPPTVLVNTGPGGDAIAFFGLATVIGALGYNLFLRRSVSKVN